MSVITAAEAARMASLPKLRETTSYRLAMNSVDREIRRAAGCGEEFTSKGVPLDLSDLIAEDLRGLGYRVCEAECWLQHGKTLVRLNIDWKGA